MPEYRNFRSYPGLSGFSVIWPWLTFHVILIATAIYIYLNFENISIITGFTFLILWYISIVPTGNCVLRISSNLEITDFGVKFTEFTVKKGSFFSMFPKTIVAAKWESVFGVEWISREGGPLLIKTATGNIEFGVSGHPEQNMEVFNLVKKEVKVGTVDKNEEIEREGSSPE